MDLGLLTADRHHVVEVSATRRRGDAFVERFRELTTTTIDKGVLHRAVGPRETMPARLELDYSLHYGVDLRSSPFSASYYLDIQYDYSIFSFDNEIEQDTVCQELSGGDRLSVQETEIRHHSEIFASLLPPYPDRVVATADR